MGLLVTMLKSKLHRARVTQVALEYEGSLTLDPSLMEAAHMLPHEKVLVVNCSNGARFETYLIPGQPDEGQVCVNGAAARLNHVGDEIIVMAFAQLAPDEAAHFAPVVVLLDRENRSPKKNGKVHL